MKNKFKFHSIVLFLSLVLLFGVLPVQQGSAQTNSNVVAVQYQIIMPELLKANQNLSNLLSNHVINFPINNNRESSNQAPINNGASPNKGINLEQENTVKAQPNQGVQAVEEKVVQLVNQERAKNGLAPLKLDGALSTVARDKSADMRDKNYFSHQSPTYGSPFDMMKAYGINYMYAGENIAMGQQTAEEVVQGWMNSQGHRENILNPNYTHIGVGYVQGGSYGHYWTQMFVGR